MKKAAAGQSAREALKKENRMAKKCLLALALAALVAGGAFAQFQPPPLRLSVGGGLALGGGALGRAEWRMSSSQGTGIEAYGAGAWVFADATFVELSIMAYGGAAIFWQVSPLNSRRREEFGTFAAVDVSLLGRFPFAFRDGRISIFPLLGVAHSFVLEAMFGGESFEEMTRNAATPALSSSMIQFGAGGDFALGERLFMRVSLLGNYRFPPAHFRSMGRAYDYFGGFGATAKVGVGLRL